MQLCGAAKGLAGAVEAAGVQGGVAVAHGLVELLVPVGGRLTRSSSLRRAGVAGPVHRLLQQLFGAWPGHRCLLRRCRLSSSASNCGSTSARWRRAASFGIVRFDQLGHVQGGSGRLADIAWPPAPRAPVPAALQLGPECCLQRLQLPPGPPGTALWPPRTRGCGTARRLRRRVAATAAKSSGAHCWTPRSSRANCISSNSAARPGPPCAVLPAGRPTRVRRPCWRGGRMASRPVLALPLCACGSPAGAARITGAGRRYRFDLLRQPENTTSTASRHQATQCR